MLERRKFDRILLPENTGIRTRAQGARFLLSTKSDPKPKVKPETHQRKPVAATSKGLGLPNSRKAASNSAPNAKRKGKLPVAEQSRISPRSSSWRAPFLAQAVKRVFRRRRHSPLPRRQWSLHLSPMQLLLDKVARESRVA